MNEALVIHSAQVGTELRLEQLPEDDVNVSLTSAGLQATAVVDALTITEGLSSFFGRLAVNWRGWGGIERWANYERTIVLAVSHDGRANIAVEVELSRGTPADWLVRANLVLEPGALEDLSRRARGFFGT